MKTIVVTGGAGFIGSNLCRELIKDKNNRVICVDLHKNIHNLFDIEDEENFDFMYADITSNNIFKLNNYGSIDQIYNLACHASPARYQYNPVHTMMTCVVGVNNMLQLALIHNAKILQASTSEVYGNPKISPQAESYFGNVNPIGIRACYDEGKRAAETLFFDFERIYKKDIRVARIFNTYGPYMDYDDGRVISNLINQALDFKKLTVYGDGSQTRSFCYISDMVDGLIKLMNNEEDFVGPVNIGNPYTEMTIKDLAEIIIKYFPERDLEIEYMGLPADDPVIRRPDISLAKEHLEWEPVVDLNEGLSKTIDYYKRIREGRH